MWYEKYELKENPYDIRNLSEKVIGEEAQEKQLVKWIKGGNSSLLYGPTGIGKTTLAKNLVKGIKSGSIGDISDYKAIYYSCDKDSLQNITAQIKKLRFWSFGSKKIVVFLDEIHFGEQKDVIKASALWDAKQIDSVVYIQIGENPSIPQLVRRIGIHKVQMRTITRDEIVELIRQRTGDVHVFEESAMQHIASNCNLNPSIALQNCDLVADELADPENPIALEQVKQFNFEEMKYNKEIQKHPETKDDKIEKIEGIGPSHKKILRQLRISSYNVKELQEATGMSHRAVSARIGELKKKNMVEAKTTSRPKKWGLVHEFERQLLSDEA